MYPGKYAVAHPDRAAFVMASSGESVSYAEFEARANRLTHLLQNEGLSRQDHYSIMMENNNRYLEACAAGERAGLYYTCINSYLTADELAYILDNSESQILITSMSKLEVATDAVAQSSKVRKVLVVDADANKLPDGFEDYATACQSFPATPIDNERLGTSMLYSSGTTGRPKGIIRPLPEQPPAQALPMYDFLGQLWHYREDMIYLSPAPLYHSAPQAAVNLTIRQGGTVIIMERFDPEAYLSLIEQYKFRIRSWYPVFSRMLKLPEAAQILQSVLIEIAYMPGSMPCDGEATDDEWGPIIHEYYGATEGLDLAHVTKRVAATQVQLVKLSLANSLCWMTRCSRFPRVRPARFGLKRRRNLSTTMIQRKLRRRHRRMGK